MKCLNCSNSLPDHAKYCGRCGEKIVISESHSQPIEDSYFTSRWKTLISLFLKLGVVDSLRYGFFVFLGFIVIEIVASLFGYCITAKSAECMGGFADIFLLPSVFGIFYFLYGSWHAIENLFRLLSSNEEAKEYFGLTQIESGNLQGYLSSKGLNTLFAPRYIFYILIFSTYYLFSRFSINTLILFVSTAMITDLRIIKLIKTKIAQSNNINTSDESNVNESKYTEVDQAKRTKEITRRVLKIAMWTTIGFIALIAITLIFAV